MSLDDLAQSGGTSDARSTAEWERREANLGVQIETLKLALNEVYDELGERDQLRGQLEDARRQLQAIQGSLIWRAIAPLWALRARYPGLLRRARALSHRYPRLRAGASRVLGLTRRVSRFVLRPVAALRRRLQGMRSPGRVGRIRLRSIAAPANADHSLRLSQSAGKRVLFFGHVMPYPPRAGNEYRIHRMLCWLADAGFDVLVVICPLRGHMPSEGQIAQAASIYPQLIVCGYDGVVRHGLAQESAILEGMSGLRVRHFAPLLGEVSGKDPRADELLSLVGSFCPDVLIETLLHLEQTFKPDAVLAEYVFMTRALPLLQTHPCKIVDTHDVFSTKADKIERYGVSDGLAMSEAEESALFARADVLIGIQAAESQTIERLVPSRKVVTVGVDFDVKPPAPPQSAVPVVLLVASRNPMNVKGLRDFLHYSWPFVRREIPDAELRVVGDVGASVDVVPAGVRILGRVESLDDAYADAWVVVNPTIAGTGLKIKTVEALSHLRRVVTFPAGVDGVGAAAMPYCHVVEHWYSFACEVARALSAPPGLAELERCHRVLADYFSAKTVYAPLKRVLDDI